MGKVIPFKREVEIVVEHYGDDGNLMPVVVRRELAFGETAEDAVIAELMKIMEEYCDEPA